MKSPGMGEDKPLPAPTVLQADIPVQPAPVNPCNQPRAQQRSPQNERAVVMRHNNNNNNNKTDLANIMLGLEIRVKDLSSKSTEHAPGKRRREKQKGIVEDNSDSDGYVTCNDSELDDLIA